MSDHDKVLERTDATIRVWDDGDYEIKVCGGEVAMGNIFDDNHVPIQSELEELHNEVSNNGNEKGDSGQNC